MPPLNGITKEALDILSSRIHLFLPFPSIGYRYGCDRITGQLANLLDRRIIIFDTFYNQAIVFRQIGSNASTKPYYRLVIPAGVYSTHIQWICPYLPAFQK